MKILLISNMYPSKQKPYSGVFVINQFNYIKNNFDCEIELFAMKRSFTSKLGSIWKYLKASMKFSKYFFKRFDVIHVHYFFPFIILGVICKILRKKTKLVVTFHGTDITDYIHSSISKKIFKFMINKCDVVISVGQDLGDIVEARLGRKSDFIISAGVDETVFYPESNCVKLYDFIFVGSFIKRKGVDLLVEAIRKIDNKDIRFCFVGSGELNAEIESLKNDFQVEVHHNKSQNELRMFYNQAKFFIIPSRDEPFGLVATEAIFCGTPAIVSNIGGLKSQVKDNVNGFIISELTSEEIKKTILHAYSVSEEQYASLSKNALSSNKEHGMVQICEKIYSIYQK